MVLAQFSLPINSLLSELPGISAEDTESKKENVSQAIARYISEALSKVDFAGIFVEKVPGIISVSSTTRKARNIDKYRQKWYNISARKIAETRKKACTRGGVNV